MVVSFVGGYLSPKSATDALLYDILIFEKARKKCKVIIMWAENSNPGIYKSNAFVSFSKSIEKN